MKYPQTARLAKEARAATGMTQTAFAEMLRSGVRTIQYWELGVKPPNPIAQLVLEHVAAGWRPDQEPGQDEEQ